MITRRSSGLLSDGRTIRFYEDEPRPPRLVHDTRGLTRVRADAQVRWDPITEEPVIVAAARQRRRPAEGQHCPLCPSAPGRATEIPCPDYDVVVLDNRYPALAPAGACEVVSFSSTHDVSLARLPVSRVRTVIDAWAERTSELNGAPDVRQVFCFENRGARIGATLTHPHGQIYAYPFVPARLARMGEVAQRARAAGRGCPACRLVERESAAATRIVVRSAHWLAFVPGTARWPYEIHAYALRHVPDLPTLDEAERADLATVYRSLLRRFETVSDAPLPYVAMWFQAPAQGERALHHLHVQIFTDRYDDTRVKRPAAGEYGAGVFVTEADPEHTATHLRGAGDGPAT